MLMEFQKAREWDGVLVCVAVRGVGVLTSACLQVGIECIARRWHHKRQSCVRLITSNIHIHIQPPNNYYYVFTPPFKSMLQTDLY